MQTIMLDGSLYPASRDLHLALKQMLSLPDYYGMNADALNDCLSGRTEKVNLWIADPGSGETADALRIVRAVIEDNGGQIKELYR
jgi:ribonuclease inhibitor